MSALAERKAITSWLDEPSTLRDIIKSEMLVGETEGRTLTDSEREVVGVTLLVLREVGARIQSGAHLELEKR